MSMSDDLNSSHGIIPLDEGLFVLPGHGRYIETWPVPEPEVSKMSEILNWLKGKKTYFLCVAALIPILFQGIEHEITWLEALQQAWPWIAGISLRAGIGKVANGGS